MTGPEASAADSDLLDAVLDGEAAAELPERLLELAAVAAELATALAAPMLSRADRERVLARARELAQRRARLLGILPRPHARVAVAAGAGGAVVTLALLGLALLRRSAHQAVLPPAVRPAA
jgi:hypothetical protein